MSRKSLSALLVSILAAAGCATVRDDAYETYLNSFDIIDIQPQPPSKGPWEHIGVIDGDPDVASELTQLLNDRGLAVTIEGSLVYGVWVPCEFRCDAVKLILEHACKNGYYANLQTREQPLSPARRKEPRADPVGRDRTD
jgi:hypothetical protein